MSIVWGSVPWKLCCCLLNHHWVSLWAEKPIQNKPRELPEMREKNENEWWYIEFSWVSLLLFSLLTQVLSKSITSTWGKLNQSTVPLRSSPVDKYHLTWWTRSCRNSWCRVDKRHEKISSCKVILSASKIRPCLNGLFSYYMANVFVSIWFWRMGAFIFVLVVLC